MACLAIKFKQQFSHFKQYYTHFHIFFHPHIFQKTPNNNSQTTLPNITHISTHFFIHTYFKKLQITILKLLYQIPPYLLISLFTHTCVCPKMPIIKILEFEIKRIGRLQYTLLRVEGRLRKIIIKHPRKIKNARITLQVLFLYTNGSCKTIQKNLFQWIFYFGRFKRYIIATISVSVPKMRLQVQQRSCFLCEKCGIRIWISEGVTTTKVVTFNGGVAICEIGLHLNQCGSYKN